MKSPHLKPVDLDALRTNLANERTFLAYIRTSMSSLVFGMAVIKFFPFNKFILAVGWVAVAFGVFILIWGAMRFRQLKSNIDVLKDADKDESFSEM